MNDNTDKRLLLLHPADNVLVCCQKIEASETILLEGDHLTLPTTIDVGHKLARGNIGSGDKIFKYGAAIGSAKNNILRAEHVHLHNIKSDYMPSYQRSGIVTDSTQPKGASS